MCTRQHVFFFFLLVFLLSALYQFYSTPKLQKELRVKYVNAFDDQISIKKIIKILQVLLFLCAFIKTIFFLLSSKISKNGSRRQEPRSINHWCSSTSVHQQQLKQFNVIGYSNNNDRKHNNNK